MIPFFRKIRYRLARDNQFLKYSRYAIGEIVLVVVGILIALYINNWYEERKEREMTLEILAEIQDDLLRTLIEMDAVIAYYNSQYLWIRRTLLNRVSEKDYRQNYNIREAIIWGGPPMTIYKNGFEKLSNSVISVPNEFNNEVNELIELYRILDNLEESNNVRKQLLLSNRDKIATGNDWYSNEYWDSEEAIEYFLNDPNYKNLVKNFLYHLESFNLFYEKYEIIKTYDLLSRCTKIDELSEDFDLVLNTDLVEFAGVYQWKDSIQREQLGDRSVSVRGSYLIYPGNSPFYQIAKDSFVTKYNNTLLFHRDSLNQIIGATRTMAGNEFQLEKIK